jgi:hypothetical protein
LQAIPDHIDRIAMAKRSLDQFSLPYSGWNQPGSHASVHGSCCTNSVEREVSLGLRHRCGSFSLSTEGDDQEGKAA